jgi:hypothetical protein
MGNALSCTRPECVTGCGIPALGDGVTGPLSGPASGQMIFRRYHPAVLCPRGGDLRLSISPSSRRLALDVTPRTSGVQCRREGGMG